MKRQHEIIAICAVIIIAVAAAFLLAGNQASAGDGPSYNATALAENLSIDMDSWHYDSKNDIYYQLGLEYCMSPEKPSCESCGIYVPGKYFDATKNTDGTYSCSVNDRGKMGNYTADSAPVVMPVNTPNFLSCKAPDTYRSSTVKNYTDAGFIYLNPGCRGQDNAEAPDGVTDLKAAVSYYRFNGDVLPGDDGKIFTFGHSGGGAQSALMGASGNSELYNPYLEEIGAAMVDRNGNSISNAVAGSMCWCPITNFDTADGAYEWYMGQYTRNPNSFESALSRDLANQYAKYINEVDLQDPHHRILMLEKSDDGIYTKGSYYDYMLGLTEESLNNFLNDTTFPYNPDSGDMGITKDDEIPDKYASKGDSAASKNKNKTVLKQSKTYKNPQEYIRHLNENGTWIKYDSKTNTANISSLEAFVRHCKNPTKPAPAFDDLHKERSQNSLFGISAKDKSHFDPKVADLLKNNSKNYSKYSDYSSKYPAEYEKDIARNDSMNNTMQTRVNMYNPMYYLCDYYDGAGSSDVAEYWRINSGIEQGDTSVCVEANLYLAVLNKVGKDNVEFSTVWEQGHVRAERTGDWSSNFIDWVNECAAKMDE